VFRVIRIAWSIWMPVNYLLIESCRNSSLLRRRFQVPCPSRSKQNSDLWQVASEISRRLGHIFFLRGKDGPSSRFRRT